VWHDFISILRPTRDWRSVVARRHIDTLVVARGSDLDQVVARCGGWRQSFADKRYRVWAKTSGRINVSCETPRENVATIE
jgi:hypothetical protein